MGYIGQIYLNLAGRDPSGTVSPGREYTRVREQLAARLLEMVDPSDGQKVVDQAFRREDLYEGPYLSSAPDLITLMRGLSYITRQSYELSEEGRVFSPPHTRETGGHRLEGMLLASGNHIAGSEWVQSARIEDLAPTILHLLGCQVPPDMDGQVLTNLLDPDWVAAHPVSYADPDLESEATDALTPEEEENLMEHLRNLGYVG